MTDMDCHASLAMTNIPVIARSEATRQSMSPEFVIARSEATWQLMNPEFVIARSEATWQSMQLEFMDRRAALAMTEVRRDDAADFVVNSTIMKTMRDLDKPMSTDHNCLHWTG